MQVALTRVTRKITLSADAHSRFNFHGMTTLKYSPCEAPVSSFRVPGVASGSRKDLLKVAKYQRGLFACILAWMLAVAGEFWLPPTLRLVAEAGGSAIGIIAVVLIALVATKIYGPTWGIILGSTGLGLILYQLPILCFLILLLVNWKATTVLQLNGIKVGQSGADLGSP
jgi:hypothetical protein